jgi:hypothetical protein
MLYYAHILCESSNPDDKKIKKPDSLAINWRELSSNPNALEKKPDSLAIVLFKKYQDSLAKS